MILMPLTTVPQNETVSKQKKTNTINIITASTDYRELSFYFVYCIFPSFDFILLFLFAFCVFVLLPPWRNNVCNNFIQFSYIFVLKRRAKNGQKTNKFQDASFLFGTAFMHIIALQSSNHTLENLRHTRVARRTVSVPTCRYACICCTEQSAG